MKLSGKCKEDFEEYLKTKDKNIFSLSFIGGYYINKSLKTSDVFSQLPESMQFGVIQDFADSKGYDIITRNKANRFISFSSPTNTTKKFYIDEHNTRQEARSSAIEKFNEMYNEQF